MAAQINVVTWLRDQWSPQLELVDSRRSDYQWAPMIRQTIYLAAVPSVGAPSSNQYLEAAENVIDGVLPSNVAAVWQAIADSAWQAEPLVANLRPPRLALEWWQGVRRAGDFAEIIGVISVRVRKLLEDCRLLIGDAVDDGAAFGETGVGTGAPSPAGGVTANWWTLKTRRWDIAAGDGGRFVFRQVSELDTWSAANARTGAAWMGGATASDRVALLTSNDSQRLRAFGFLHNAAAPLPSILVRVHDGYRPAL
jgi:hypothetical protein